MLKDLVAYAQLSDEFVDAIAKDNCRLEIEEAIIRRLRSLNETKARENRESNSHVKSIASIQALEEGQKCICNPFVSYLSSLQRTSGANENALAEFQARNPLFYTIHVRHPVTDLILDELRNSDGRHVILTGDAGDGKSTVALAVYRELARVRESDALDRPVQPREDLAQISIIKDLSERKRENDPFLLQEIQEGKRRFLIVSNTGALLDFLCKTVRDGSLDLESDVLTAISAEDGCGELVIDGARFVVYNLARMDNLAVARQVFVRMIDPERWAACQNCERRPVCPNLTNVELIRSCRERVLERLFLAYRRMHEYGTRLTMRQITEHFAYMLTPGLVGLAGGTLAAQEVRQPRAAFMFFNRFFGDDGQSEDVAAQQMRAVQEVRKQGFGERPCCAWERDLWLHGREDRVRLGVPGWEEEFQRLRRLGSKGVGFSRDRARDQVRRMLYFLHEFTPEEGNFLAHFLNSPAILQWQRWQKEGEVLGRREERILAQSIGHVLQEHFAGIRLPEWSESQERRLYVTLGRGRYDVRQSAQVVLAQIDWARDLCLKLVGRKDRGGSVRVDLELQGQERLKGSKLVLSLPFLDYVLMRHQGELGETLQPAYVERLTRLKAQIQALAGENPSRVMLVRLKSDNTFRSQQYAVSNGKLEVTDVG